MAKIITTEGQIVPFVVELGQLVAWEGKEYSFRSLANYPKTFSGKVISFDDKLVVVWAGDKPEWLPITSTQWVAVISIANLGRSPPVYLNKPYDPWCVTTEDSQS